VLLVLNDEQQHIDEARSQSETSQNIVIAGQTRRRKRYYLVKDSSGMDKDHRFIGVAHFILALFNGTMHPSSLFLFILIIMSSLTPTNNKQQDFPRFHHISTGDSLRQHVKDNTPVGIQAKSYMEQGKLVPDSIMIDVVMEDATPHLERGHSLLLDGFPRTLQQAQALEEVARIDLVVNLDIPTETIVERIADRCVCCCRVRGHLLP
jgi:Adenylate kinase